MSVSHCFRPRLAAGPGRAVGVALVAGVAGLTGTVLWPWLAHAAEVWATVEAFGYGFLVPPISLFLVWWRWPAVRASLGRGAWSGLPLVVFALAGALVATRAGINALAGLAAVPLLWGTVATLWGWRAWRTLAFPIGFLAFGLGVHTGALSRVGFALQGATATGAGALGRALGLGVTQDGLVLRGPAFAFVVAEQCSGMSSLLSLLALAALWGYLASGALPARLVLVASVLPLVLLANTVRVTLVLVVAAALGQEAALGVFHGASSFLLFGIALGGMLLTGKGLGCGNPRRVAWS